MSGPQGPDPTQPRPGSQPPSDPAAWQQPPAPDQPTTEAPAWGQNPAYTPQQYPGYQQPGYPPAATVPRSRPVRSAAHRVRTDVLSRRAPRRASTDNSPNTASPINMGSIRHIHRVPRGSSTRSTAATGSEESSKKSMAVILGVVGVLVAVVLIVVGVLGFWKPGWFVTTQLDVNAAQSGVAQILSDETNGYGAKNVEDVKCNDGKNPTVAKGANFTCEVSIDGTKRQVTVTFQDDNGTYEVGRPK